MRPNIKKTRTWRKKGTGSFYDTRQWRNDRALFLQANPLCVHCKQKGFVTEATIADHTIPINQGGDPNIWANGQPLCDRHHNKKTALESKMYNNQPGKE